MPFLCRLCGEGPIFGSCFCGPCRAGLSHGFYNLTWRTLDQIKVVSLATWDEQFDLLSREILYEVKENRSLSLFNEFSRTLISKVPCEYFERAAFVPVPSSTGRVHSSLFAQCLARWSGGDFVDVLSLALQKRQPGQTLAQRRTRRISVSANFDLQNYKTVIFVDDVVTSGSTLTAAAMTLPKEQPRIGMTLLNRALRTEKSSKIMPDFYANHREF